MAAFNKFNSFVEAVMEGKHDFSADTIKYALVASANPPSASDDAVLADITQITYTYLTDDGAGSRALTVDSSAQTSGTYKLVIDDLTITASGGTIATFRYVVLFNDSAPSDELIGWYDYGTDLALSDTETLLLNFDGTNGVLILV
jgi:hypothetical protein